MIKVSPLFSGSKGNSTLIQYDNKYILLDAGYTYRALLSQLSQRGVMPSQISAIVITHEHSDHIGALKVWTKNHHTKVYAPKEIVSYLAYSCYCSDVQPVDGDFDLLGMQVKIYRCSHDSRACLGYKFCAEQNIACVTDTGIATDELPKFLSDCQTVLLESNHDEDMLWQGSYPYPLKRRIASNFGHLSNGQASQVLQKLLGTQVQNVVLMHLSLVNNTKQKAWDAASAMYALNGVEVGKDINLFVADQFQNEVIL